MLRLCTRLQSLQRLQYLELYSIFWKTGPKSVIMRVIILVPSGVAAIFHLIITLLNCCQASTVPYLRKWPTGPVWASPVAELSRDSSVPTDLQHLLIGVSCRCSRESHVSPQMCTATVPRSHPISWLLVFHYGPPVLTGGLCCQPGTHSPFNAFRSGGRRPIPKDVRNIFGTSCYEWFLPKKRCWCGFQLQFKLRNSSYVVIIFIKRIRFFFSLWGRVEVDFRGEESP